MKKLILYMLALMMMWSCSRASETASTEKSNEQIAFEIFRDSLLNKKIYAKNLQDSNELVLPPNNIDSAWLNQGMFHGYKLFANGIATDISTPYYDSLTLFADKEYFNDSTYAEANAYIADYKRLLRDTSRVTINVSEDFSKIDEFDFSSQGRYAVFLKIKRKIKSRNSQMVEIQILRNSAEGEFLLNYFRVFFDKNDRVINWTFN